MAGVTTEVPEEVDNLSLITSFMYYSIRIGVTRSQIMFVMVDRWWFMTDKITAGLITAV